MDAKRPDIVYGKAIDRVLEDIMDVPARPIEVKEKISELFLAVEMGKTEEARRICNRLKQDIGTDPALVKADFLIRRKEKRKNETN